jgi:hypothetical protein
MRDWTEAEWKEQRKREKWENRKMDLELLAIHVLFFWGPMAFAAWYYIAN